MNTTRYLHQKKEYNKCQIIEAHYILNSLHKPSVVFMVLGTLCSYTYRNKYLHEGSER